MTVPGIGPIISSATVAAIGNGAAFAKGRELRRLARTGAKADIDGRPYHPRQDIQARQSLSALSVRAGSLGRIGQGRAKALGPLWAQVLDRGCQKTSAPQCAGDRARQQACPHRLGGSQQGAQIRVHQDKQDVAPSCLSVAPCSDPSRRGLARLEQDAKQTRRPALTAPCAWRASTCAGRDEGTGLRHEQRNCIKIRSDR